MTEPRLELKKLSNDGTLAIFDQLAEEQKQALSGAFSERNQKIAECGNSIKETVSMLRARGCESHEAIWNSALFLNTVAYDLSIGVLDLVYERDHWKRRLIARTVALIVYEIGEDIPAVFGKKFRDALKKLKVPEDQTDQLYQCVKLIAEAWNENRAVLKEIRTISAAHRDHDALAIHKTIDAIDVFELVGVAIKLGTLLNRLGPETQKVMTLTGQI